MLNEMLMKEIKLKIADIIVSFKSNTHELKVGVNEAYKGFVVHDGHPDMFLQIRCVLDALHPILSCSLEEKIFQYGDNWSLFRCKDRVVIIFRTMVSDCPWYRLTIMDEYFKSGDIYIGPLESHSNLSHHIVYRFGELLLLMTNYLSKGKGVILHCCCLNDHGQGILFSGESKAGKSTIAELWKGKEGVTVLTDDRAIIRKIGNRFYAYGTPWHSTAKVHSPEHVPIEKIFFIKHAKENAIVRKEGVECVSNLLVRLFPPFWSQSGMQYTLQLLDELGKEVPCYELGFVPNETVLDFARRII